MNLNARVKKLEQHRQLNIKYSEEAEERTLKWIERILSEASEPSPKDIHENDFDTNQLIEQLLNM